MDVRSCRGEDWDLNQHLFRIKHQQKTSKYQNTYGARQRKCDVRKLKDSEIIRMYKEEMWVGIPQSVW
jgi:hypothetical protein